jgi:octaprenyl-diphosphate synthase
MTIDRIRSLVSQDFDAVNALIIDKIQSQIGLAQDLSEHLVNSGGKRLRPMLVLLASRACGYQGRHHIDLAAMVEFFHTATLLHDDVVDESTLRRGRQTANTIWGNKASVLVGDYLFTQSVQLMVQTNHMKIIHLLADTSHQISSGEVRQLASRHNSSLHFNEYFEVIRSKTSYLFAAAAGIGPILAESAVEIQTALYQYGLHLGNAFQLIDDALDYCSDAQTLGKNIGDDLADGKVTLPLIYALEQGTDKQQQQIKDSLLAGSLTDLDEILLTLQETKAIEYTQKIAKEEMEKALSCLSLLAGSEYKEALIDLAYFALLRTH